jgi:hypothetical protein
MRILFFFLLALSQIATAQEKLTPFSELSGKKSYLQLNAARVGNNFWVQGIYPNGNSSETLLFKLNQSGKIMASLVTAFNGQIFASGEILHKGNRSYQLGYVWQGQKAGNIFPNPPMRAMIVLDSNLTVLDTLKYDIVPPFGYSSFDEGNGLIGDTIISVREYGRYDAVTGSPIAGRPKQIEKLGIKGEIYGANDISDKVSYFTDAVVTQNRVFVFAYISAEGNNTNIQPVGEFDFNGKFVKAHVFDAGDSTGKHGNLADIHKNMIYHTHDGFLDKRNDKFQLQKRIKLTDDFSKNIVEQSYDCFAFDQQDNVFYLHLNQNSPSCTIYKVDANHNLQWSNKIENQGAPRFILETNDGGCIIGLLKLTDFSNGIVQLFKLNSAGNIVSSDDYYIPLDLAKNLFYPNPFQSQLTLHEAIEGASEVQLYDMSGRIVGIFPVHNTTIEINEQLPKGAYIAQLKDVKGSTLGTQTIVKQ